MGYWKWKYYAMGAEWITRLDQSIENAKICFLLEVFVPCKSIDNTWFFFSKGSNGSIYPQTQIIVTSCFTQIFFVCVKF